MQFANVDHDVLVVGAGFSGLYAVHALRSAGYDVKGIERAPDVGGTWFWNRYPGARCDVESVDYCYSFDNSLQEEWNWSEKFAPQEEILAYMNWVADRLNLRRHYRFATSVTSAVYDPKTADGSWQVETDDGRVERAKFLVLGCGNLSVPYRPDIPGIDDFTGEIYQSSAWPETPVELTGKHVMIVGTGSTAIQMIPEIAQSAKTLHVLQRTPGFSLPARNTKIDDQYLAAIRSEYPERRQRARESWSGLPTPVSGRTISSTPREEVEAVLWEAWRDGGAPRLLLSFDDIITDERSNKIAADFVRARIRETVSDPEVAEKLLPRYPLNAKRVATDSGYFEAFNRDNVHLVDISETPIERIEADGVVVGGQLIRVDTLIFATGFDAVTGALLSLNPVGTRGTLREHWADGPKAYMGLSIAGFPNMFVIAGVGTATVVTAILPTIEHNVQWITKAIDFVRQRGLTSLVASEEAESDWMDLCGRLAEGSIFMATKTWQNGRNIEGKNSGFMAYAGGVGEYIRKADAAAAVGYAGFVTDPPLDTTPAEVATDLAG